MSDTFILFTLAGTTYGLRTRDVAHIEMVEQITGVPNAAHFVDGVVFSRGLVVPAVNLRARFGLERTATDLQTRLVVVQAESRLVGLLVDSAREFLSIPVEAMQPPSQAFAGVGGGYIEGVANIGGRLILVVDLGRVLNFTESTSAA